MENNTVGDIRKEFKYMLDRGIYNDAGLLEIVGASFIADRNTIFGTPNNNYINAEIMWYNSKSLNVYDMHNPPKIWKNIADKDGNINSNYGWCIFSDDNGRQYYNVLKHLKQNKNSRKAVMIYNRPTMHNDYNKNGMQDFICTNAVTYSIDSFNTLNCVVQMRSNDAVYGYKNDYAWQRYILNKLAKDLNTSAGSIIWQAASLHIYPRHFKLINKNK